MTATEPRQPLALETNGMNVIPESERKGGAASLFWPWFAANVAVLGLSYGAYLLGFGISFWQAMIAGIVGIVVSFLLVGFVSLAGKRGSAPTMILSRAAFGVRGNGLPALVSYLLLVGYEIFLVATATLATATVFSRLGWGGGNTGKIVAFAIVMIIVFASGMLGFEVIMRVQTWITVLTLVLTLVYFVLVLDHIHWARVSSIPGGSVQAVVGAAMFAITGFGLSWANTSADYSRYLPRSTRGSAVVGWTTFGASVAPIVLIVFGALLAGSDDKLNTGIQNDPIGALTTILPTWYVALFGLVAILGIAGGCVLDIYSSGLVLLTVGYPGPRWSAAFIDGVLTVIGTVYIVWFATDFITPFLAFLSTLGVPIAAWVGVFLADLTLRRQSYADDELYDSRGRYGAVGWPALGTMVLTIAVGWGLVANANAGWLHWQGYLLGPLGLGGRGGTWAAANLGVVLSIALAYVLYLLLGGPKVRRQESLTA